MKPYSSLLIHKKSSINGTKFQIPCKIDTLQNINYSLWLFIIAFATACFFFIFDNINQFTFWTFDNWIKTFPSCSMLGSTLLFTCMYIIFHGKTLKFRNTSWNKKWTTDYANTLNHRKIKIWRTCMYMVYSYSIPYVKPLSHSYLQKISYDDK